jgi:hypothetical protein
MVTITPLTLWWWEFFHQDEANHEQIKHEILAATGMAALGYGVGNALAWVMDAILEQK